jgi:hypothetical protein
MICCNRQRKTQAEHTGKIPDTLQAVKANVCLNLNGIEDYAIKNDTLWILSGDDFLYYPFGIYQDINQMAAALPFMNRTRLKSSNTITVTDNFYYKRSSIVTFLDENRPDMDEKGTGNLETVYARIADPEIVLANGFKVGLNKQEFAQCLSVRLSDEEWNKIDVVLLESVLLGVWNYYYFSNSIDSIVFKTDYQIDLQDMQ